MTTNAALEQRVQHYWTARTRDFSTIRKNELHAEISGRWSGEMRRYLPSDRVLDILDAGTGTGYFAVLLAQEGHRLTGIDITASMLSDARDTAEQFGVRADFLQMDVQATSFPDACFDAVVCRNLVWTLPDPAAAYREWHRVLRPGGILLVFDADYAQNVRNHNQKNSWITPAGIYGHIGVTPALARENAEITFSMPASRHRRPAWDLLLLGEAGFSACGADGSAGARILRENDLADAPLFLLWAKK